MTTAVAEQTIRRWGEPAGVNPRGTLAVIPGRGESADVCRRFAARISPDAYRVTVLEASDDGDSVAQLRTLAVYPWAVSPFVVVGSDSGVDAITSADLAPAAPEVPVLAVHGGADDISPLGAAEEVYRTLPILTVAVVKDGRHDILNDVTHRSVAATVVLFLERLRLGVTLPVIVQDASPR